MRKPPGSRVRSLGARGRAGRPVKRRRPSYGSSAAILSRSGGGARPGRVDYGRRGAAPGAARAGGDALQTYLFSGYARLPQDVSHQNVNRRVGIVVELDERGVVTACSSTLLMDLARDFFARLLTGRSLVTERAEIEATSTPSTWATPRPLCCSPCIRSSRPSTSRRRRSRPGAPRRGLGADRRSASSPKGRNDRRRRVARGARRRRAAGCHGAGGVARGAATDQSPGRRGTRRHVVGGAAARI